MEITFKFGLGDTLRHVVAGNHDDNTSGGWAGSSNDCRYFVLEQVAQICPGGLQIHYACRVVSRSGVFDKASMNFLEHELVLSEPFEKPDEEKIDEAIEKRDAARRARGDARRAAKAAGGESGE